MIIAFYEKYQVIGSEEETLLAASDLRLRYALSFWDSLVIASAMLSGVEVLYSEDLQHKQIVEGRLQIINPFLD